MDIAQALLDPEQRRLQARRRAAGLIIAPALALLVLLLAPDNMSPRAARLLALLAATIVIWLTEALPMGVAALCAASVAVLIGVADAGSMFAPFADKTVWILLAAFVLGETAQWRQLDRVFAVAFFSARRTRVVDLASTIAVAAFAASAWLPSRMVVALLSRVVTEQNERFGIRFERLGLSSVAFATALGGLLTPMGAPSNLIALAALSQYDHRELPLLYWTLAAAPLAVLLLAAWLVAIRVVLGQDGERVVHGDLRVAMPSSSARRPRPPTAQMLRMHELPTVAAGLDRGQLAIALVLIATLAVWALPGVARLLGGDEAFALWSVRLPPGPIALVLVAALFVVPAARRSDSESERQPVATWEVARNMDWDVLLLVGCGLALGQQSIDTGLSHWLGDLATRSLRVESDIGVTVAVTAITLAVTQLTSATVAAAICAPLAVVMAQQLGVSPTAGCFAVGMAARFGVLLPMSDECNQIIWATGRFQSEQLLRRGLVALVAAFATIPVVALGAAAVLR